MGAQPSLLVLRLAFGPIYLSTHDLPGCKSALRHKFATRFTQHIIFLSLEKPKQTPKPTSPHTILIISSFHLCPLTSEYLGQRVKQNFKRVCHPVTTGRELDSTIRLLQFQEECTNPIEILQMYACFMHKYSFINKRPCQRQNVPRSQDSNEKCDPKHTNQVRHPSKATGA